MASTQGADVGGGRPAPVEIGPEDTIAHVFAKRVAATPDKVAYREHDPKAGAWRESTWREVGARVGRVAAALAAEGLAPGDRVGIMLKNGVDWVAFDMGAHATGLVVVPIYVDDRPDNVAYILEDADVRVLLVGGEEAWRRLQACCGRVQGLRRVVTVQPVAEPGDERVVALDAWQPAQAPAPMPPARSGRELATIVYTSGTTGRPKGVMLSHQNMLSNVKAALEAYEIYPGDSLLSFLPMSHMFERTVGYYLTVTAGGRVSFARSIAQLAEDLKTERPTVLISVPRIFERLHAAIHSSLESQSALKRSLFHFAHAVGWDRFLWQQGRGAWKPSFLLWPVFRKLVAEKLLERLGGRMRLCVSGGAALNAHISRTFIGLGVPICQGYGLTEAAPIISVNRLDKNEPSSIGQPLPGIEVRFGPNDELQSRGPNVMMGYWKLPEATAKVIDADGWLATGDQAKWRDGFLYITGRIKEIIVLGNGEKVPPVDMELAIQLDPLFEQALVIGEGKPFLAAMVVLNDAEAAKAGPMDEKALATRLSAQLKEFPGYAQIRKVAVLPEKWTVDNGLLTSTLKPRRNQILERHADRVAELYKGHVK